MARGVYTVTREGGVGVTFEEAWSNGAVMLWNRERRHDVRAGLFGGRGEVRVWNLGGSESMLPFTAVLACELECDGVVGEHVQEYFPEVVVVIEGRGKMWVSGVEKGVEPGVVVALPLGETLKIENGSHTEVLRYLIVKTEISDG